LYCSHCGREVSETIHSKKYPEGFRVDYYVLVTGQLAPRVIKNPKDESIQIEFFKVENPRQVITCCDCLQLHDVQEKLDQAFLSIPEVKKNGA